MGRVVRAEIEIDAPVSRVWAILTDLAAYAEWNPFTPRVESTLEVGAAVHLDVRLRSEGLLQRVEYVTALEHEVRASWGMKIGAPWILAAERNQILTPLDGGRTHYVSEDHVSGVLTPIVIAVYGGAMERGFRDCAEALKKRAEAR